MIRVLLGAGLLYVVWFVAAHVLAYTRYDLEVEAPSEVRVGETFELRVRVTNKSLSARRLMEVVVGEDFLRGVEVLDSEPRSHRSYNLGQARSFPFFKTVPRGETQIITLRARAIEVGLWQPTVGVYLAGDGSSLGMTIPIIVHAEPEPLGSPILVLPEAAPDPPASAGDGRSE